MRRPTSASPTPRSTRTSRQAPTPSGTAVGSLSATDPDGGQTITFTLEASGCSGSFPDTSSFQIAGKSLQSAITFDFETRSSYTICVRATDDGVPSLSFDEQFTVDINGIGDAPVDGIQSTGAVGTTLVDDRSAASR